MRPAPVYPLATDLIEDTSRSTNLIRQNAFTFAYRFVYVDGEISGLSPYSEIVHHLNPDDSTEYDYNTIELSIPNNQDIGDDVAEIEFLVPSIMKRQVLPCSIRKKNTMQYKPTQQRNILQALLTILLR